VAKVGQGGLQVGLYHGHKFFCQILLGLLVKGHVLICSSMGWVVFVGGFGGSGDVIACVLFGAGGWFG